MPSQRPLALHLETRDGVEVIVARGELDLAGADALPEAVRGLDGRPGPVVVDMSEVGFMDSSGLRSLLEAQRACAESGRTMALLRPSGPVMRVLELVDLTELMPILADVGPAELAALSGTGGASTGS